jgi:hypothetical protein
LIVGSKRIVRVVKVLCSGVYIFRQAWEEPPLSNELQPVSIATSTDPGIPELS